jgi:hypothetical protein
MQAVAPRMMILVFILFLSGSTELHCPVVCCNWLTPRVGEPRKIIFHKNTRVIAAGGVVMETADKVTAGKIKTYTKRKADK